MNIEYEAINTIMKDPRFERVDLKITSAHLGRYVARLWIDGKQESGLFFVAADIEHCLYGLELKARAYIEHE